LTVTRGGHIAAVCFRLRSLPDLYFATHISADVAQELRRRCDLQMRDVPSSIQGFVARHEQFPRQLTLRLV
jgi:hypothetical protein